MRMQDTLKTFDKIIMLGTGIVVGITWIIFLLTRDSFVGIYSVFILVMFGIIWLTSYMRFTAKAILEKIKGGN
jgi:hypothetical protein